MSVQEQKSNDSPDQVIARMKPYWNQGNEGSFHWIYLQIQRIERSAIQARKSAIRTLSEKENAEKIVEFKRKLKGHVEDLRNLEERLKPLAELLDAGFQYVFAATDQGDFSSFFRRVEMLKDDVARVYKDALYPFLLALKNAEKRWKPSNLICTIWDTYSWYTVKDPKAQIDTEFPVRSVVYEST